MRKENIAGARRKYPATGWLPDDYQIAEDLLLIDLRKTQQLRTRALTEASIPHLLSQPEEFVLYPSQCALAGRRPDKLGVFFAPETGERTIQFPGRQ
jgi:hypothetical protein